MSKLQSITIEVDLTDAAQNEALCNLLRAMGGVSELTASFGREVVLPATKAVEAEPEKPAAKAKGKAKPMRAPAPQEEEAPQEAPQEESQEEAPALDLQEVRRRLADVIAQGNPDARDKCAEKLNALGAKNVSTLDPSKYEDFVKFLKTLEA